MMLGTKRLDIQFIRYENGTDIQSIDKLEYVNQTKPPSESFQVELISKKYIGVTSSLEQYDSKILPISLSSVSLHHRITPDPLTQWSHPLEPSFECPYVVKLKNALVIPHFCQRKASQQVTAIAQGDISIKLLPKNCDLILAHPGLVIHDSLYRYRYLGASLIPNLDEITNKEACAEVEVIKEIEKVSGRYLFVGTIANHFGHLLVESPARLWIYRYLNEVGYGSAIPIGFGSHGLQGDRFELFPDMVRNILNSFTGEECQKIRIVKKPLVVEELLVPRAISPYFQTSGHEYALTLRNAIQKQTLNSFSRHKKIYLSRSKLYSTSGHAFRQGLCIDIEMKLERYVESLGYAIVYPETLPFFAQVSILSEAKSVISTWGSQFHLIGFCKPMTKVLRIKQASYRGETDVHIAISCNLIMYDLIVMGGTNDERSEWSIDDIQMGEVKCLVKIFDEQ